MSFCQIIHPKVSHCSKNSPGEYVEKVIIINQAPGLLKLCWSLCKTPPQVYNKYHQEYKSANWSEPAFAEKRAVKKGIFWWLTRKVFACLVGNIPRTLQGHHHVLKRQSLRTLPSAITLLITDPSPASPRVATYSQEPCIASSETYYGCDISEIS